MQQTTILQQATPDDLRHRGYFRLLDTPIVGDLYILSRTKLRSNYVGRLTELVIDGFPRSANSYAREAFQLANSERRISTHLHSPRSIDRALRFGIPAIVLIRDPRDAVASLVHLLPGMKIRTAFERYTAFYSTLMGRKEQVVIAEFERVRRNFGEIVDECNDLFGTDFGTPGASEEDVREALRSSGVTARLESYQSSTPMRRTTDEVMAGLNGEEKQARGVALNTYREFTS